MQALNHEYSKVVSEGLRVAGSFVFILRFFFVVCGVLDSAFNDIVEPLFFAIQDKLQKTDIDQEVKQCSIIAMASFISVAHKKLSNEQIAQIINIYNDRLQNELTRDATLKAITKMALNQTAPNQSLIPLNNLYTLTPKLFDLLHKVQRSLHLTTLETLVAIVSRYPD